MKRLKEYINESYKEYRLNEVDATYDCYPDVIYIEAPESYQESDIQQYMDDSWLNKMPSSQDYANNFFGKNDENIYDVYFKYDKFEHITVSDNAKDIIKFNSRYASKQQMSNEKLDVFKITNLKFIIKFDRFDLTDVDENNVKNILIDIFKTTESNDINKYPLTIKFNEDELIFTK